MLATKFVFNPCQLKRFTESEQINYGFDNYVYKTVVQQINVTGCQLLTSQHFANNSYGQIKQLFGQLKSV